MLHIHKILVPTDLSPSSDAALHLAFELGRAFGAEVHALHVTPVTGHEPVQQLFKRLLGETEVHPHVERELQDQMHRVRDGRWDENLKVRWMNIEGAQVASEILLYADEKDIDLVVMGTHGHRMLESLFLGSVSGEVLRRSEQPVLTVRKSAAAAGFSDIRRILVPVDFSKHSGEGLQAAKELAHRSGATLALLFVAEERIVPVFSDTGLPALSVLKMEDEVVQKADAALRQLYATTEGPDIEATFHVSSGNPVQEILDFAEREGIGMMVMTTPGAAGTDRFSLGSVAEKVAHRASCPVLTLKAFGHSLRGEGSAAQQL